MTRYVALLDGEAGGYGVAFPDAPGCTAMGETTDEAIRNAIAALSEWMEHAERHGGRPDARTAEALRKDPEVREQLSEGAALAVVPLIFESGRSVRANLSMDAGLLMAIDEAAAASGLTRSAFLASAAREKIVESV